MNGASRAENSRYNSARTVARINGSRDTAGPPALDVPAALILPQRDVRLVGPDAPLAQAPNSPQSEPQQTGSEHQPDSRHA